MFRDTVIGSAIGSIAAGNLKTVSKYVGKGSGIKGWFLAISTGILSHGPIYV